MIASYTVRYGDRSFMRAVHLRDHRHLRLARRLTTIDGWRSVFGDAEAMYVTDPEWVEFRNWALPLQDHLELGLAVDIQFENVQGGGDR